MIEITHKDICKQCPMYAEAKVEDINPCGNGDCLIIKDNWHETWRRLTKEAVFLSEVARRLKFKDDDELDQDIFEVYEDVRDELDDMTLGAAIDKARRLISS